MWAFIKKHNHLFLLGILLLTLAGSYLWNQQVLKAAKTVDLPVSRTGGDAAQTSTVVTKTSLAAYQEKREQTRLADMEALKVLAVNTAADEAAREQAQAELQEVVRCRESELAIEGALTGMGLAPCVAVVQKGAVTVLVQKEELTGQEAAAVLALAVTHSGESPENVRILAGNMI